MRGKTRLHSTEHEEQAALFQWADVMFDKYPVLNWMYAIPNGDLRKPGVGGRLKAEGVKAGVPDICLPVARGRYHALYIEMKSTRPGAKLSQSQAGWKLGLSAHGNLVVTCFGWEAAVDAIERYLNQ